LAGVYDEIVVDPCYARWATFLHRLWGSADTQVSDVLDVCCGTGLMAKELISLGYRVVGVDASAAMLGRARELLGPDADLTIDTLPQLTVSGTFDAAISTFDGLNYLTPQALTATFLAVAERLRPGGWLVFDLHTDAMMHFTAANPTVQGSDHGHDFAIASAIDVQARTCDTRVQVIRTLDHDSFVEEHRQYFFSDRHVRAGLTAAGFGQIAVFDEYSDAPADRTTFRATWVARLPHSASSSPS
jgi:SAM-dependent methyltransferase